MHPDYPPRARIEWVIAGARVVLAVGSLFAIWLDPSTPSQYETAAYTLLVIYLAHSVATLALVWKPVEFARAWGLAGHIFDLAAFSAIMFMTEGASSPFFVYFVFSVICGALRWESKGALLTAAVALSVYAAISGYEFFTNPAFQVDRFVIRIAQLTVVAALLAYLTSYFPRTLREVLRFASWPHVLPQDESHVVNEIIERANEVLAAPRILVVWQERGEEYVNLAWRGDSGMEWIRAPRNTYEPTVGPTLLRNASFQARNVADASGRVDFWHKGRFRELIAAPINESLRQRFDMHAVQSSKIEGSVVDGYVFWLDRPRMRIDDLVVGDLVARLAASRLESAYLVASLRETSALNERLRVARDLHDSVLQSLAGTGYQLAVASRVLTRDPEGARQRLQDAQNQLEHSEREMRALIRRLRPQPQDSSESFTQPMSARLQAFGRRIEEQWRVALVFQVAPAVEDLPIELREQLLLIVQEAVLNAAKHAGAATIRAALDSDGRTITARIVDDGKGFAFDGAYDLATLTALEIGPLTLKERVTELRGDLHIQSSRSGSNVRITLPVPQSVLTSHGYLTRAR